MINPWTPALRIAVIGPSRFGIGEPFAGGLEAHTAGLIRALHIRGHELRVFAGPDGDPHQLPVDVTPIVGRSFDEQFVGRRDTSHPPGFCQHESEQYRSILGALRRRPDIDVVHNNSLHPSVVDADPGDGSFVHVLHCPPFPKLESAHRRLMQRSPHRRVVAVSMALASQWSGIATDVVHNGVDLETWCGDRSTERSGVAWAGRLVEEKAPHLAIRAARLAGETITLAGPIGDQQYFDRYVRRELNDEVRWLGPLAVSELAELFRASRVGVVSPMWDEPFCLVAAEMLAAGLPVAAFDRGGLHEFVLPHVGSLATPGDAASLAAAIRRASTLDPLRCEEHARNSLSSTSMVDKYEILYSHAASRTWTTDPCAPDTRATA